jgi:hypothetical protein
MSWRRRMRRKRKKNSRASKRRLNTILERKLRVRPTTMKGNCSNKNIRRRLKKSSKSISMNRILKRITFSNRNKVSILVSANI